MTPDRRHVAYQLLRSGFTRTDRRVEADGPRFHVYSRGDCRVVLCADVSSVVVTHCEGDIMSGTWWSVNCSTATPNVVVAQLVEAALR